MGVNQLTERFLGDEKKVIKSIVKKYSKDVEIPANDFIRGSFEIKNVRLSYLRTEAHIVFKGELFARRNRSTREWLNNSILAEKNTSKIKVNKLIRKFLIPEVMRHLLIFGIETQYYTFKIYKTEWV